MKKRVVALRGSSNFSDNSFGVAALIFGVLSIIFYSYDGIIFGILGIIFALKQRYNSSNNWVYSAITLSIIGLIISLAGVLGYLDSSIGFFPEPESAEVP